MVIAFDERMGKHLLNKFLGYNRDVIRFWASLDLKNERKFIAYINRS